MSISLEVSDVAGEIVLQLPVVYSRPSLPVNLDNLGKPEDLSKWNHLRDVDLPRINAEKVTLLIGQDNPEALVPTDLRKGAAGEPYAMKTVFGWTVNGPLGGVRRHVATANFVHVDRVLNEQLEALVEEKRGLSFEDKRVVELKEEINWPKTPDLKQIQEEDPEVKKVKVCLVQKGQPESLLDRLIKRRSSWMRLKKDVAWILRLNQWLQAKCNQTVCVAKGPITVNETDQAELEIVKFVQNEHFKEDITELSQNVNKSVKKSSRLFKLAPVLTSKGVLVV